MSLSTIRENNRNTGIMLVRLTDSDSTESVLPTVANTKETIVNTKSHGGDVTETDLSTINDVPGKCKNKFKCCK